MRWILVLALLPIPACMAAQEQPTQSPSAPTQPAAGKSPSADQPQSQPAAPAPTSLQPPPPIDSSLPLQSSPGEPELPDSPGAVKTYHQAVSVLAAPPPCKPGEHATPETEGTKTPSCTTAAERNPYQRFLNSPTPLPLTPRQKGLLAIHDVIDPGNLFTITANAGFTVGIDPHTAYGAGWGGFGRNIGYSLVQDATGEFFSTFAIDSLLHQDPHYHRSPRATIPRRFLHAVSHTVISQHDDGTPMINYSTLLTYPISAEIANLYVPGVHGNGPSTIARIATGLASDPIDNLITEFLPDFARRVHIRVVFVQQLINKASSGASSF